MDSLPSPPLSKSSSTFSSPCRSLPVGAEGTEWILRKSTGFHVVECEIPIDDERQFWFFRSDFLATERTAPPVMKGIRLLPYLNLRRSPPLPGPLPQWGRGA